MKSVISSGTKWRTQRLNRRAAEKQYIERKVAEECEARGFKASIFNARGALAALSLSTYSLRHSLIHSFPSILLKLSGPAHSGGEANPDELFYITYNVFGVDG